MKFLIPLFMTSVISAAALPSATLLASSATNQPACSYPIGSSNGKKAKVSGRLFEIDGKVEYFAGGGVGQKFNSTAEVAAATLFGPALIEVD
jgi:mannan endo-1,4-beta-mannosidase